MLYRSYILRPPLSDFVELFWLYDGYAPPHAKEHLLPTGTMERVVNLREDRVRIYDRQDTDWFEGLSGSVLCGAHAEFFVTNMAQRASVIGVHFQPGGAFPFLHLTAGELLDAHVSLGGVSLRRISVPCAHRSGSGMPDSRFPIPKEFRQSGICHLESGISLERFTLGWVTAKEKGDWLPARSTRVSTACRRIGPGACPLFPCGQRKREALQHYSVKSPNSFAH
jgi:hypothetical protein